MSDDESVIEEEYLIYAELCDNADPNIFKHAESSFSSFALDSDQPLLIIGGQAFVGTYRDTVGSAVFLEETPSGSEEQIGIGNEPSDPLFVTSPTKRLQYVAHTRKTLEMSRVLLLEKNKEHEGSKDQEEYLAEDSVELDNLQNKGLEGNPEHNEIKKERPDIINLVSHEVKTLGQPDIVSIETDKILLKGDNVSLMMNERLIIENIEKIKITGNVNATIM